jgi:hypothetical protein
LKIGAAAGGLSRAVLSRRSGFHLHTLNTLVYLTQIKAEPSVGGCAPTASRSAPPGEA